MAVKRASAGGGGDWIDWVELGGEQALVAVELLRWDPDKDLGNGPVSPAVTNVLICDGSYAGTVKEDEEIIGKGMTNKLKEIEVGDTLLARVEVKTRGSNTYAVFQRPTDAEADLIEEAMQSPPEPDDEPESEPDPEPEGKASTRKTTSAKAPAKAGAGRTSRRPFG
jgi:hypothetical protein